MNRFFPLQTSSQEIGGKAANLYQLAQSEFNIPKWEILPVTVFETLLEDEWQALSPEKLQQQIELLEVPSKFLDSLKQFFGAQYQQKSYAVRSSAVEEDGMHQSFAGQYDSHLEVPFQDLALYIKKVWASILNPHVIAYRKQHQLSPYAGIAVIIQEMIQPKVAGVGFGIEPVSKNPLQKVVSACYGYGEGLVSGDLVADTFTIKEDKSIESKVAHKEFQYEKNEQGNGLIKKAVPLALQKKPTLNNAQILTVNDCLSKLASHYQQAQDIEFAFDDQGTFYLLQSRPITTAGAKKEGAYTLWDNSNIIESYPGVTTPLTFSFIIKMYEKVYRQFVGLLGVSNTEIDQHEQVFKETLGLVRGRVYYNLLTWYRMLAMVPGYSINARYMENMMGVKERFDLDNNYGMGKGKAWFRIVLMVFKMIRLQTQLPAERKKFLNHLNQVMEKYQALDFTQMPPKEIVEHYLTFEKTLLLEWKAPLINDFFAMIWFGMLEKQCKKYCPEQANIHNDLLCGSQDIISVEPIHRSFEIVKAIEQIPTATALFKTKSSTEIWLHLNSDKALQSIKALIDNYLTDFGERCIGELKLETISYSHSPTQYIDIIKAYIQQGISKVIDRPNTETSIRSQATATIEKAVPKGIKKWWFNKVLNKARDLVSNRENLRYERTRGFGMVRKMFTALGEKLAEQQIIHHPRDVFYLELEEITSIPQMGFSTIQQAPIEERKATFAAYEKTEPPVERFSSYGNDFSDENIYSQEKLEAIEGDLKGIGCCPGVVEGQVQVIKNPQDSHSLNGDILVTSSTDPGWVTLFPTTAAIIIERGSLLSHSAIVSREMGIPCIVGVTGLLRTLKTGDHIKMDGHTGVIKIIKSSP